MEDVYKKFGRELLRISDEERERFAREVHDELAQELFALKIQAESMADPGATDLPRRALRLSELAARAEQTARALARGFDPILSANEDFREALNSLIERYENKLSFDLDALPTLKMERSRAAHLYRIVQEAVTNAFRHGGATRIRIGLARTDVQNWKLEIEDNGSGFDLATTPDGFGLRTMFYRSTQLDGILQMERLHNSGMLVTCTFRPQAP